MDLIARIILAVKKDLLKLSIMKNPPLALCLLNCAESQVARLNCVGMRANSEFGFIFLSIVSIVSNQFKFPEVHMDL